MVKVFYFDYHGVLDRRSFAGMLEVIAKAANPTDWRRIAADIRQIGYDYACGKSSHHLFWHTIEQEYGPAAQTAGRTYTLHVEPILPMWNLLNELKPKFALGLCTDIARDKKEVLRSAYALTDYFDHLIFSCDVKTCKRDPEFYQLMRQHGQYQPTECVFIDDNEANTSMADEAGFMTHTFRDVETLRTSLATL